MKQEKSKGQHKRERKKTEKEKMKLGKVGGKDERN
jgi:hypothetical protein